MNFLVVLFSAVLLDVSVAHGADWCRVPVPIHQNASLPSPQQFTYAVFQKYGNNETCTIKAEGYELLLKHLKIGTPKKSQENSAESIQSETFAADILDVTKTCYSGAQLLHIHDVNVTENGISREQFTRMTPAFVQQISHDTCQTRQQPAKRNDKLTQAEMFGWGTLIVFIICLGTLPGGLLAPFMNTRAYRFILAGMMGLAVGSLLGDGVLHLIPDALGLDDLQPTPPNMVGKIYVAPYTWKLLCLCCAAWAFFVLEMVFITVGKMGKEKDQEPVVLTIKEVKTDQEKSQMELSEVYVNGGYAASKDQLSGNQDTMAKAQEAGLTNPPASITEEKKSPISLAYMILIGDAIHNFADGLAIGAALNVGWRSGLSTSIAIFCHEVPHELGDFAALLSVGWSYKKAMVMNFISGMSAFLGLYVGIPVANNLEARQWIFAFTAGLFLYISLSDLVPELLDYFRTYSPKPIFIAENLGILVGLTIMMIIVIFEDHIAV